MSGTLFIIATPIGNLEDASPRVLRTLGEVDVLYCEDTRVTGKILSRFEISVPTESYRDEVHSQRAPDIIALLKDGKNVGYVSDAGTPGISDPGTRLVETALAAIPDLRVEPIPGPSAVTAAMSICGFPGEGYVFMAFPPHKKGRAGYFKEALAMPRTVVCYESPHRIEKTLDAIAELAPDRRLCLCRELTKLHETVYRGTAADVLAALKGGSMKGEYVLVIERDR
jgi:16S rRNA (cytidine1402-2'-O)-methyltransferase